MPSLWVLIHVMLALNLSKYMPSFIHSFINLFNKYLFGTYYVLVTYKDIEDTATGKMDQILLWTYILENHMLLLKPMHR
jgi:hypothetical protein